MSEEIFKQSFDYAPVGIGIVNNERKLMYANNAYYSLHGYTAAEMANQDTINFICQEDIPIQHQAESKLLSGETNNYEIEVRIRCKDARETWVLLQGYIMRKTDGSIDYGVGFFTDITAKKNTEKELLIKSYAVDSSVLPIGFADMRGTIFYANQAFAHTWGYHQPAELIGMNNASVIRKQDMMQEIGEALQAHGSWSGEIQGLRKDGSTFDTYSSTSVVKDKAGKPLCIMASGMDISQHKQYERDLLIKSHAIDSSVAAILMSDMQSNIFYANQTLLQLWGYDSQEEITGKSFMTLAQSQEESAHTFALILQHEKVVRDCVGRKKDGTTFLLNISGALVKDQLGNPVCIMAFLEDITLQKAYEKELLVKSHALASSSAGVVIIDNTGEIVYVNKALLDIAGLTHESDLIGKNGSHFNISPEQTQAIGETVQSAGEWRGEMQIPKKDGTFTHIEMVTNAIINKQGVHIGRLTWISDITHRKQTETAILDLNRGLEEKNQELQTQEEELRAANEELTATVQELHDTQIELESALQDLQQKNFELDQFVYKTSHDLRAPLTTILGLVDILKKETDEKAKTNYVHYIENRILRLDSFIKSMLDYSRSVRSQVVSEPVMVKQVIDECLNELEYMKNFSRLHITVEADDNEVLYTDGFRLKIIFNNIISNAIKYQNESAVESKLRIRVKTAGNQAEIVFADNGIGIRQEYINRIFTMFFRATDNSEGSGLGLYIVKQAVQALRGSITLKSESGVGTETTILLPRK